MTDCGNNDSQHKEEGPNAHTGYPGALELNVEKYLPSVEEFDITEAQRIELLRTLWAIMSAFVDLGWGIDNVQNIIPALMQVSIHETGAEAREAFNLVSTERKGTEG